METWSIHLKIDASPVWLIFPSLFPNVIINASRAVNVTRKWRPSLSKAFMQEMVKKKCFRKWLISRSCRLSQNQIKRTTGKHLLVGHESSPQICPFSANNQSTFVLTSLHIKGMIITPLWFGKLYSLGLRLTCTRCSSNPAVLQGNLRLKIVVLSTNLDLFSSCTLLTWTFWRYKGNKFNVYRCPCCQSADFKAENVPFSAAMSRTTVVFFHDVSDLVGISFSMPVCRCNLDSSPPATKIVRGCIPRLDLVKGRGYDSGQIVGTLS